MRFLSSLKEGFDRRGECIMRLKIGARRSFDKAIEDRRRRWCYEALRYKRYLKEVINFQGGKNEEDL